MEVKEIIPGVQTAFLDRNNKCPNCDTVFDVVTAIYKNGVHIPNPGDYSICIKCSSYLQFDEELQLKALDTDDVLNMPKDVLYELTKARNILNRNKN